MGSLLDASCYRIGPVFRGKDQVQEKANEGWGQGGGGTLSGSDLFLLPDRPGALPTAKPPAPFQGAACAYPPAPQREGVTQSLAF